MGNKSQMKKKVGAPKGSQRALGNKGGTGRPTKYKPEYAEQATGIAALGSTDAGLARVFSVNITTIDEWRKKHPEFDQAVLIGKAEADNKVQESLFKRAVGFESKETKQEGMADPESGKIVGKRITKITKEVAADVGAATLWLKNRDPDNWREKQEIEHVNSPPVNIYLPDNGRDSDLISVEGGDGDADS